MSSSRPPRRLPRVLLAVLLACSMPGIATAEEGIEGGAVDIFPRPLGSSNLLEPIGNLLSGRASLIARGMDPGFGGGEVAKPGDPDGADVATGPSPVTQGASAALVPYRNPGPAFSTNVLITRDFSNSPYQTEPHLAVDPNDPDAPGPGHHRLQLPLDLLLRQRRRRGVVGGPVPRRRTCSTTWAPAAIRCSPSTATGHVYMTMISIGEEEFTVGPVGRVPGGLEHRRRALR